MRKLSSIVLVLLWASWQAGCSSGSGVGARGGAGGLATGGAVGTGGAEEDPVGGDYVIVAADNLAASAARYRDFREAGGFGVDLVMVSDIVGDAADAATASARIRDYVMTRYQARDTSRRLYLLLLGDAQTTWPGDGTGVPAGSWLAPSSSKPVISDNVYADFDDDDVPELAVGRITADSDAEADLVREKIAAHESTHESGQWNRRLSIFASTSGMGDMADSAIESIVYDITEAIPYAYDVTMTYARQSSPYVYVPEQFSDQVYQRINEGALLVAYVGHGASNGFARLDWNGQTFPILDTSQLDKLAVTHRSPILLFVACSTGAFVGKESISERILVGANAPTAIMSSTVDSDPYANAIFIYEVSQAFLSKRAPRVGDAFLQAKQAMLTGADSVRQKIESLGGLLVSASARESLRHSHLHMYTLFGDPGMAMTYPADLQVTVDPSSVGAGSELTITAHPASLGAGAEATVTLESPRKIVLGKVTPVPSDGAPERDAVIMENYRVANDKASARTTASPTGAPFTTKLTVPADLPAGAYHIKVFVSDASRDYAGSVRVTVK